jgi:hypothetical protein
MLRIFVTSSHLSTMLMAIYANKSWQEGYIDILLTDATPRKESLIQLIIGTSKVHSWYRIYNFSPPLNDTVNMKPSLYKTVIRKAKTKPVIKQVYGIFYRSHMKRKLAELTEDVRSTLKDHIGTGNSTELYMLTETILNKPLMEVFPQAEINYMEHGQGDYMYMLEKGLKGNFRCVFANSYKEFLKKRDIDTSWVKECLLQGDFENASKSFLTHYPVQSDIIKNACSASKKNAVILLDAVEIYNVSPQFWNELAEKCVSAIEDPSSTRFIIKPHPAQSYEAMAAIKTYFTHRNIEFVFLDRPELTTMSVEVMFALWREQVSYVLTIFSTSVYYMSEFYPGDIKYYYSYRFMSRYTDNAPQMYKEHFYGLKDIIKEALAVNCIEL